MNLQHDNTGQLFLDGFHPSLVLPVVTDEKLPTNSTANRHTIHRWFNFVAGFAPEFVAQHCPSITTTYRAKPGRGFTSPATEPLLSEARVRILPASKAAHQQPFDTNRRCNTSGTGSLILDPFAGCGTTLVVARALGHRAIDFEPHPFFLGSPGPR